jgi:orotate phosphoribosyltransferase-like protein
MKEANMKLDTMNLPEKERRAYDANLRHLMNIASRNHTIEIDAKDIIKKAKEEEEKINNILGLHEHGVPVSVIAKSLKISEAEVLQIIENQQNK